MSLHNCKLVCVCYNLKGFIFMVYNYVIFQLKCLRKYTSIINSFSVDFIASCYAFLKIFFMPKITFFERPFLLQ